MLSLLYVSVSKLSGATALQEVEAIVTGSMVKNARQGITGALIFTGSHFAQVLEGDDERVDALMREICLDNRHSCVTVIRRWPVSVRRFESWSMAYSGGATYIGRPIEYLLEPSANTHVDEIDRVYALMEQLVATLA